MRKLTVLAIVALGVFFSSCSKEEKPREGYSFKQEYAVINSNQTDDFTGDLTIDLYMKLESYPKDWAPIVAKMTSQDDNEFNFRIRGVDGGRWSFAVGGSRFNMVFKPKEVLPLNTWVRMTAVRNMSKKTLTLYVDGKRVAHKRFKEIKKPVPSDKNILLLSDGKRTVDATISEMRIWNKALNNNDLEKTAKMLENPAKQKNLVGYWLFTEKMETIPADLSKAKRTMSLKKVAVKKEKIVKEKSEKVKPKTTKAKETKKKPQ